MRCMYSFVFGASAYLWLLPSQVLVLVYCLRTSPSCLIYALYTYFGTYSLCLIISYNLFLYQGIQTCIFLEGVLLDCAFSLFVSLPRFFCLLLGPWRLFRLCPFLFGSCGFSFLFFGSVHSCHGTTVDTLYHPALLLTYTHHSMQL